MNPTSDYASLSYSDKIDEAINTCYLCGLKNDTTSSLDHIIPDNLFRSSDEHRPKLPVHHTCNNLKSKEDEWFLRQLQVRSSFNPQAQSEINRMMDKAIVEKPDAYVIGKKLYNYKKAKSVFEGIQWGLELRHQGQSLMQMRLPLRSVQRFQKYLETMIRGLFIRNVSASNPSTPELTQIQWADLELKGKDRSYIEHIKKILNMTSEHKFGQQWGDRVFYIGSPILETPSKGYIFMQFYTQFCVLAFFR